LFLVDAWRGPPEPHQRTTTRVLRRQAALLQIDRAGADKAHYPRNREAPSPSRRKPVPKAFPMPISPAVHVPRLELGGPATFLAPVPGRSSH